MIKFPKVHIATSVVNRILNIADGLEQEAPGIAAPPPTVPDPTVEGQAIDAQLAAPISPNLPGLNQSPDPGATVSGAPLLDTMVNPNG